MMYGFATGFSTDPLFSMKGVDVVHIAHAGFDYIEFPLCALVPLKEEEKHALLGSLEESRIPSPVACNLFPSSLNMFTSPLEDILHYLDAAFATASVFGIDRVVFGSGAFRQMPEGMMPAQGYDALAAFTLKRVLPLAREYRITVLMECLNRRECNLLNTLAEGLGFVKALGRDEIRLMVDTYHMEANGELLSILELSAPYIRHVHVAEKDRMLPLSRFSPYQAKALSCINAIGYDGTISYETKGGNLREARSLLVSMFGN